MRRRFPQRHSRPRLREAKLRRESISGVGTMAYMGPRLRVNDAAGKPAMTAALSGNLLAFLGAGSAAFGACLAQLVLFFVLAAFLLAVEANLAANLCQPGEMR